MIHSDPMNQLSICTQNPHLALEYPLMDQLEQHTRFLGWIWSAGEDQKGFWCEIFTPKEVRLFQAISLEQVLQLALSYTTRETALHL